VRTKTHTNPLTFLAILALGVLTLHTTAHATPISLELNGGTTLTGELVSWDGKTATIQSELGEMKLPKEKLSPSALETLALTQNDPAATQNRVAELEATIASLRRDNAALRAQIEGGGQAPAPATAPTTAAPTTTANAKPTPKPLGFSTDEKPAAAAGAEKKYWISTSGKRHNENCKYFENSKGKLGTATDGTPCKVCGG
jgi:hypothetical protein